MAKQAPKKKASKTFTKRLFIPGFGFANIGDTLTPEIEKAWKEWTSSSVSDYVK